jgi:hypothetical protein
MEMKLIRETGANDPAIGYNRSPRWRDGATYGASAARPQLFQDTFPRPSQPTALTCGFVEQPT